MHFRFINGYSLSVCVPMKADIICGCIIDIVLDSHITGCDLALNLRDLKEGTSILNL